MNKKFYYASGLAVIIGVLLVVFAVKSYPSTSICEHKQVYNSPDEINAYQSCVERQIEAGRPYVTIFLTGVGSLVLSFCIALAGLIKARDKTALAWVAFIALLLLFIVFNLYRLS